jgi:hypothetical protein
LIRRCSLREVRARWRRLIRSGLTSKRSPPRLPRETKSKSRTISPSPRAPTGTALPTR